jgi:hypothetical protein
MGLGEREKDLDSVPDRRRKMNQGDEQEILPSAGVSGPSPEDLQERKFQGFP